MYTKTVQPRFCTQATQLSRLSNEAAFQLHESKGLGPGILAAFVEVNINLSVPKIFFSVYAFGKCTNFNVYLCRR